MPISPDAALLPDHDKPLSVRPRAPALDALIGIEHSVLNHGFVQLLDYMGGDPDIAAAARASFGPGAKTITDDARLIRRLWLDHHTSPFEMVEAKFRLKMLISTARQWVRYRTANWNEQSGRYKELPAEYHTPARFRRQSSLNKQGSDGLLDPALSDELRTEWIERCDGMFSFYHRMLDAGVAREQARGILPLDTYTVVIWKNDLRNILHFLDQRTKPDAQAEIRAFADVVAEIVALWVPAAYAAWREGRGHV